MKNPKSLAAAAQVSSILNIVGSAAGGGDNTSALSGFADTIVKSSTTLDLTSTQSMMSIIINTATVSSTSVVFNEIQNIASITTSVVAKIDTIDTENTDVSTFSKLEEISVASENVAETIEDSGSSTTIDVDSAINDASGSVDTDNLFEPTRAEKGIRKLKQLSLPSFSVRFCFC